MVGLGAPGKGGKSSKSTSGKAWNGWVGKDGKSTKSTCEKAWNGWVGHAWERWEQLQIYLWEGSQKPWNAWVGHSWGKWEKPKICLTGKEKILIISIFLQVFDEEGKNVTPQPLFHPDPNAASIKSIFLNAHGKGLCSGVSGVPSRDGAMDWSSESSLCSPAGQQQQQEEEEEEAALSEAELEQRVEVLLAETDTLWMLHLPPALLSTEAQEAPRVLERNKIYAEICEAKIGSEYFEEKIVQTISGAAKTKEVQCETITVAEKANFSHSFTS
uniref:Uncharacterized protein n=1 Tax=Serinus canaria TaxID=9135 RepID=A0A8C9MZ44_SERCA